MKMDSSQVIQYDQNQEVKYFLDQTSPKLPFLAFFVLLPHNAHISKVFVLGSKKGPYDPNYPVSPALSSLPAESAYVRYADPEIFAGYRIQKVFICPFRYTSESDYLVFCSQITLDIFYQIDEKPLILEHSADKIIQSRQYVRDKVLNAEDLENIIPLAEKMDYTGLDFFKTEADSLKQTPVKSQNREKTGEPFFIRQIK